MNSTSSLTLNLTKSQQQAVSHKNGPLLVIAGPGSGKTRVITSRIAALIKSGVSPYEICAITFTNKAAEEMRQRVYDMNVPRGVHVSTFHSLCVRILRQYSAQANISPGFSIYDDTDQRRCIKEAIKLADLDAKNFPPRRMLEAISRLKNNLQDVETFEARSPGDYFSNCLLKVYRHYQNILNKNNSMDFDDLLLKTAFLLRDDAEVRQSLNHRFRYLMVDEYQDTNHAQYQIARGLSLGHGNICVTGDPDQSIYGWRGADIGNIMAFEKDWPQATVIKLEENFRSGEKVLSCAESLISNNKNRKLKRLIAANDIDCEIISHSAEDESAEAAFVAEYVKNLIKNGNNPNQIAVFYRVNSMSRALEEAFIDSRINYQIVRGVEFYGRKEIRDMLAYLKVVVNPSDSVSLLRIINTPARGIGKTTIGRINGYAAANRISFYEGLKRCSRVEGISPRIKGKIAEVVKNINEFTKDIDGPVADLMEKVFKDSGLLNSLQTDTDSHGHSKAGAIENIEELINGARKFDQQSEDKGLVNYLQQIALFSDTDAYDAQSGKVSMMTLHAAKGLEFEDVIIIGLEHGILPHERSFDTPDEMEEERRLFFVGLTRAKKRLAITMSRYRTVHGQTKRTIASQFLSEANLIVEPDNQYDAFKRPSGEFYEDDYSQENNLYTPKPTSIPKSEQAAFVKGQLVSHKKFGMGRVKDFREMGDNSIIVVAFNSGQTKPLMLKYANLTKID